LNDFFASAVNKDLLWAGGSLIFVFLYISFHLKSVFLGFCSVFIIILSLPVTLVIYSLIFQIKYYAALHNLVIFIVLGVGADDVFVLYDAWTQSLKYEEFKTNTVKRLAYTLRRSFVSVLVTSSTTSIAFLSNAFSQIMPIKSFGYFASIIIAVNFVLVLFILPVIIIFWEKYIKHSCLTFYNVNSHRI
jgi:protein dispatched 1